MARLLVIDDDAAIRDGLSSLLRAEGHLVATAADGRAGLLHLAEHPVDLVITDILMPQQDGIETILELRRNHPQVKIVAISAGSRLEKGDYLNMAGKLGANRTLAKPFSPQALLDAVSACLPRPEAPLARAAAL